jgi:hypothetical protein
VEYDEGDELSLRRVIFGTSPDAFLIDLSRRPAFGRHLAMALRGRKGTRMVPIVFVDGEREKVAETRAILPDATYTTWRKVDAALARAIAKPPAAPIVPPSSIYTGRPAAMKLGIKEGMNVCVQGAPPGFVKALGRVPADVKFSAKIADAADLYLCVARSVRELAVQLATLARRIERQPLWIIWAKKASGVKSDINGNIVRHTGLAAGLVDFKVCSIDETWSGLGFKRRR